MSQPRDGVRGCRGLRLDWQVWDTAHGGHTLYLGRCSGLSSWPHHIPMDRCIRTLPNSRTLAFEVHLSVMSQAPFSGQGQT